MDKSIEHIFKRNQIPDYRYFDVIGSTNQEALEWIEDGAREYSVILTDAQTAGRGRQGRTWVTTPGASIAISIILHPTALESERMGLFSLLGGLAARKAISNHSERNVQVKWPNDILIAGKKTAGILAEAAWDGTRLKGLVIGIGINVLEESVPEKSNLLFPATCIEAHSSSKPETSAVIDDLLHHLQAMRPIMLDDAFTKLYLENMAFLNENILLREGGKEPISGEVVGIDPAGNLLLKVQEGNIEAFPIGDVSLRPV